MCHCIFRHPQTPTEHAAMTERLEYARRIGDTVGVMVALAGLTTACTSLVVAIHPAVAAAAPLRALRGVDVSALDDAQLVGEWANACGEHSVNQGHYSDGDRAALKAERARRRTE